MCWNPKYIVFLMFIIFVDYFCGLGMGASSRKSTRKIYLSLSLLSNLGILLVFKYFDFFAQSLSSVSGHHFSLLNLMLPIGLSFHVFQSLAYSIEVYRYNVSPEKHMGIFALYVMFFPQLVAGPIERPQNLLSQFRAKKEVKYSNIRTGGQLALWGLFKKVCIADLIAGPVNQVYSNPSAFNGPVLMLATIYFTIQIYCDFSGYTDIARGVAKMLGYDLMLNFKQPYFARSIKGFWQRWHISLSTWFRDYLYYPLGGNRVSNRKIYRNLLIVFIISGLWHGAAWTFILWGLLHAVYMIFGEVTRDQREKIWNLLNVPPLLMRITQVFITLNFVMVAWVLFRANSVQDAMYIITHMYIPGRVTLIDVTYGMKLQMFQLGQAWLFIAVLFLVDYMIAFYPVFFETLWKRRSFRWPTYLSGTYALIFFGIWGQLQFIYFQF
ncbi:MAG: MBOAT family protein [Legionellaceae bacterium]|nr:MBOAT family protein [Legionellaceae bacterium]